jgi:hypothetical protein
MADYMTDYMTDLAADCVADYVFGCIADTGTAVVDYTGGTGC